MDIKYRNEIKYACTEQQLTLIESRIRTICRKDPHVGDRGAYTIRSVYFDDFDNSCFYENEDGTDPREKYRIRIYNGDINNIVLECKRKMKDKNHKDSCPITYRQCSDILNGTFLSPMSGEGKDETDNGQNSLLYRFFLQYAVRPIRAKVVVEYERTPYIYRTGNVRITFDRNISGSAQILGFLKPQLRFRPVMPVGMHVLEVKYDELIPDYLYNVMQLGNINRIAYSKYYICRRFCG